MSTQTEVRKRGVSQIIRTLEKIDEYNITNDDAKMLNEEALIHEICLEFGVSSRTAKEWYSDAKGMYKFTHGAMLQLEKRVRSGEKDASIELTKNGFVNAETKGISNA